MAGLASMLEDYRNWRGRQDWQMAKDSEIPGLSPEAADLWEQTLGGVGTHNLGGLAGAIKAFYSVPISTENRLVAETQGLNLSHFGSGFQHHGNKEGAQSHGHGLYFSKFKPENGFIKDDYAVSLEHPNQVIESASPLSVSDLMDWAKPLSRQSDSVKSMWDNYMASDFANRMRSLYPGKTLPYGKNPTGEQMHKLLIERYWPQRVSDSLNGHYAESKQGAANHLLEAGIPGIKYLIPDPKGFGKEHYVIFDDRIPRIISRNGQPVNGLAGILESQ